VTVAAVTLFSETKVPLDESLALYEVIGDPPVYVSPVKAGHVKIAWTLIEAALLKTGTGIAGTV